MSSPLSSHTTEWSRSDDENDRDLIALINEARTPEAIEAVGRTARARFRRRSAESAGTREHRGLRRGLRVALARSRG